MWLALCTVALLVVSRSSVQGDDSLKSAVKALHRKQRDISLYQNPYLLGNGQPEDIGYGFQKSIVPNSLGVFDSGPLPQTDLGTYDGTDSNALEKLILDYLQDEEEAERYARYPSVKRSVFRENSAYPVDALQSLWNEQERDDGGSAFRERNGNGNWRLRKAHALVRNFGGLNDQQAAQEDALNVLNSIWEKYRAEESESDDQDTKNLFEYNAYPGADEDKKKRQYGSSYANGYDFFNSPFSWTKRDDYTRDEDVGRLLFAPRYGSRSYRHSAFDDRYRNLDKRYPIAKRSTNHQREAEASQQTDPKIQREISDIFSPHRENTTEKSRTAESTATTPPVKNETKKDDRKDHGQKELSSGNALDKPLDVKKKSIRWADYFGVDKRKMKSAGYPAVSDDWLVDQYMKAAYGNRYSQLYDKPKRLRGDDMDSKLRAMEDLIVDQAIKYTGAHEGTTDPNEMEEVKDQVMGQLAAAYSLEKMRRALGEFRTSIQQQAIKPHHHIQHPQPIPSAASEVSKAESKIKAVPTVQAKVEKKNDARENQVNTNLYEEFDRDEDCPVLDVMVERCSVASAAALDKEAAFLPLCVLHQICDQCGEGDNCDMTFLRESGRSCGSDGPCRLTSRRILDAVHALRPEALACHHPCLASFLAKRR